MAFTAHTCDPERDENRSAIWIAEADRPGSARPLTSGDARDRCPRFSPDGRRLAFISDRADSRGQVHVLPLDGGEARRIETDETVQDGLTWSPDGCALAFVARAFAKEADWRPYAGAPAADAERARTRAQLDGLTAGAARERAKELSDIKVVTRLLYRLDGAGDFGDRRTHVFTVPVDGRSKAARLTDGDFDHAHPAFSPDGRFLLVAANRREGDAADLANHTDLWAIDLETGRPFLVLQGGGPVAQPVFSPDGTHIAFIGHDGRAGLMKTVPACWVLAFRGCSAPRSFGEARNLTGTLDRPVGYGAGSDVRQTTPPAVAWSADGRHLFFPVASEGDSRVYRSDLDGNLTPLTPVGSGGRTVASFAAAPRSGALAYVAGDAAAPDEVYVLDATGHEIPVTGIHAELLRDVQLQPVRHFRYEGAGRIPLDGWFIPPAGAPDDRPAPAVLTIHGGPHSVYGNALQFLMQLCAADGMAVVYTNPRGSGSYGQAFADACSGDWGGEDWADVQNGLDHAIEQGWVDATRCGVTGWSYGGFMTSWAITQTARFRAAVAGAIIGSRHSFYGTSDIGVHFGEEEFPGNPWEREEGLLARSPLRYVEQVATPVLLLHGEDDLRCPIAQTEEFFTALRRQGKPAVMVRYPGEYHGLAKPRHKLDRMERTTAWFAHHLGLAGSHA